jgi:hypothetical protein
MVQARPKRQLASSGHVTNNLTTTTSMYFPTATAQSYATRNPLNNGPTAIIDISVNENRTFFCVLTKDTIAVWRVRVCYLSI